LLSFASRCATGTAPPAASEAEDGRVGRRRLGRALDPLAADPAIERRAKVSPDVTVSLEVPASPAVVVTGEVEERRSFPLEREIRLFEAIARAGSATELAAASRARVIRRTGPGAW
jgi:protein involved in polysaccharide export with SLBB domain